MMTPQQYFEELIAIDNVHPNEEEVLDYIMSKLDSFEAAYVQDDFGNIICNLYAEDADAPTIAINGHVDIAAPLNGRKVVQEGNILKTDGISLLGGDDKTAVACMLKLAEAVSAGVVSLNAHVQLIFTRGEEAGLKGARALDYNLFTANDVLVLDWSGPVSEMIARAPAYVTLDVTYTGKQAHPAEWQNGVNAGQFLMQAAAKLTQGEYQKGATFNIGRVEVGQARNQVPGEASLLAEVRSFSYSKAKAAANEIAQVFKDHGEKSGLKVTATVDSEVSSFELNQDSDFAKQIITALKDVGLKPNLTETYGCFDGNVFATHGKQVVVLGAGYYKPHGPEEYLKLDEFNQMYDFIRQFVSA